MGQKKTPKQIPKLVYSLMSEREPKKPKLRRCSLRIEADTIAAIERSYGRRQVGKVLRKSLAAILRKQRQPDEHLSRIIADVGESVELLSEIETAIVALEPASARRERLLEILLSVRSKLIATACKIGGSQP